MLSKTVGKGVLCALLLALMMVATARAQNWWNPDYAMRIPVAITNNTGAATPSPCTAEVTISPIPSGIRSDWADIAVVYWNGTTGIPVSRHILTDAAGSLRIVFRLQAPIANGGTSNAYAIYYGNPSPITPGTDPKSIYDKVLDFSADTVGQPPLDWIVPPQILPPTVAIVDISGVKHMVVTNTGDHRRVMANPAKCPTFLNVEMYARMMPYPTRSSGEISAILRTPTDPYATEPNDIVPPTGIYGSYGGGFGVSLDSFGDSFQMTRFADPNVSLGGAMVFDSGIPYPTVTARKENIVYRVTGTGVDTTLSAKAWKDGTAQPGWTIADHTDPTEGSTSYFENPGVVAFNSWGQSTAIEFYAMREVRNLSSVTSGAQTGPVSGPYIQGTVSSTKLGPLANVELTITDGVTTWAVTADATGKYKITLPDTAAGYTLTANYYAHQQAQVTGVHPTPMGQTNLVLTYKGVLLKGIVRDRWYQSIQSNVKVVLTDTNGYFLTSTKTSLTGEYEIQLTGGGSWIMSAVGYGRSARTPLSAVDGETVTTNLMVDIPANGDCETPDETNSWPDQWDYYDGSATPPTFRGLSREQNHTPGGFWSMKVWKPLGTTSLMTGVGAGSTAYPLLHPIIPGSSYTMSVWVYFTAAGDRIRLRMRESWPVIRPPSIVYIDVTAGSPPWPENENKGGLVGGNVPVNQWYEVRLSWPFVQGSTSNPVAFGFNLLTYTTQTGTVYFDDVTMTATPVSLYQVIGKVVDQNGKAIPNPIMGEMHYNGKLLSFPSPGDSSGVVRVLTTTTTPLMLGAWKAPENRDGSALVPNGALVGTASATPIPYDPNNNTISATVVVNTKARNILTNETTLGLVNGDSQWSAYLIDKRIDKTTADTGDSANPADWVQVKRIASDGTEAVVARMWDNNLWQEAYAWPSGGIRGVLSACSDNSDACGIADRYRTATVDLDLGSSQTIDQLEFAYFYWVDKHRIWISDTPFEWNVELPNAQAVLDTTTDNISIKDQGFQSGTLPYDSDPTYGLDWYQIYRFDPPIQGRYLRIRQDGSRFHDGHQIMLEMRAMSASAWTPTFTRDDLTLALKLAAGLEQAFDTDIPKLDANKSGAVTIEDAAIISRTIVAES